jgi:hypothetical protein
VKYKGSGIASSNFTFTKLSDKMPPGREKPGVEAAGGF